MVTLDEFLSACETTTGYRARRTAHGYLTRCPAHEDRMPSLSLAEGERFPVVVRCFAGCTFEQILAVLRLEPVERPVETAKPPRPRRPEPPPEALPSEADVSHWVVALFLSGTEMPRGAPRLERRRDRGVRARARRRPGCVPDPRRTGRARQRAQISAGTWPVDVVRSVRALRGQPRELFPAPEIVPVDDVLVLVEGEPDAVTATALGLRAVGVPGNQHLEAVMDATACRTTHRSALRRRRGRPHVHREGAARARPASEAVTVIDLETLEPGAKDLTEAVLARRARGEA